ncbi:orotidine-5'-phosphate decarboxylase [Pelagibacterium lentulum]|uniref:Orotidine 5'-phosphate decarboxylase n=1 Tax=Pelagibacterium lentulum TaxID=2029865 RepID=A0A916R4S9_9HYPH|nr:orotidine-5'-phosphate decarboxylase [Pelagibacterium lentulum]GGA37626.1 orotidine 5'-phosphate decarboxylase [Pelagibacterium lentulum]
MSAELIVGLDVASRTEAERIVEALDGTADFFKIGYQLFYGGDGLALGKALLAAKKRVFFDLKLLDIDNTVEKGVAAIAQTGATMLTVHAYPHAMKAAVKGAAGSSLCVLGVTVLTSLDQDGLSEAGYDIKIPALVAKRSLLARETGIGGIVASAFEAERIRKIVGPEMAIVTPGIRPQGAEHGDQKRVMTPAQAVATGATHLVVGRPIVAVTDPKAAAQDILAQMGKA